MNKRIFIIIVFLAFLFFPGSAQYIGVHACLDTVLYTISQEGIRLAGTMIVENESLKKESLFKDSIIIQQDSIILEKNHIISMKDDIIVNNEETYLKNIDNLLTLLDRLKKFKTLISSGSGGIIIVLLILLAI